MKVYPNLPDNCSVAFTPEGVLVTVILNVSSELTKFLPQDRLNKGFKYVTFCKREYLGEKLLTSVYGRLVRELMVEIRQAKIKALKETIEGIQISLL